jgi:hypothetical protein
MRELPAAGGAAHGFASPTAQPIDALVGTTMSTFGQLAALPGAK